MNVLLITTDQHKANTLGCYGDPMGATPVLDRLAAAGARFAQCRTQNPFCQPARATLLTGMYPSTHGVVRNGIDLPDDACADSLATLLADAGFATALIGKAHFASYYPNFPTGRIESIPDSGRAARDWRGPYFGFQHVELVSDVHNIRLAPDMGRWNWGFGPPPMGLHYGEYLFRDGHARGVERLRLMQPEAAGTTWGPTQTWKNALPEEDHPTTWIADRAVAWLEHVEQPFFAWISFPDPHHPFDPPHPWCDRFRPDDMTAVLPAAHPDELDGKPAFHRQWSQGFRGTPYEWANPGWALFTNHERLTILAAYYGMIAQLDHAVGRVLEVLSHRGLADETLVVFTADHGDYMGEHQMMLKGPIHYEALIRVPFIVHGPGMGRGAVVTDPVGTIDVAPTVLRACGFPIPATVEGRPLGDRPREWVLTEDDMIRGALAFRTVTTRRHRLTRAEHDAADGELYDLDDDPGELVNRWADPALRHVRAELLALLDDVMRHDLGRELPLVCQAG
jgi:arylsulfatase A-like enzyme